MVNVHFELAGFFFLAAFDIRDDAAVHHRLFGQPNSGFSVVGPLFRDDVQRTLKGRIFVRHLGIWLDKWFQNIPFGSAERCLFEQDIGEGLQATFARNSRARSPLRLERQVNRLQHLHVLALDDLLTEWFGEKSLFVNGFQDGGFP